MASFSLVLATLFYRANAQIGAPVVQCLSINTPIRSMLFGDMIRPKVEGDESIHYTLCFNFLADPGIKKGWLGQRALISQELGITYSTGASRSGSSSAQPVVTKGS